MTNLNVGAGANSYLSTLIAGGVVTNIGNVLGKPGHGRPGLAPATNRRAVRRRRPAIINPNPTITATLNIFSVTGGTNITGGLFFGTGAGLGSIYFTNAAVMYIGSQGIASNGAASVTISLNDGGLFGATANWTGSRQ